MGTVPEYEQWQGLWLSECPRRSLAADSPAEVAEIVNTWRAYRKSGVLPTTGGWLEQPAAVTDAIVVCDAEFCAYEKEQAPKSK